MTTQQKIGVGVVGVVVVAVAIYLVFFAGGQTYTVNLDTSCKATPDRVTISPHDQVSWVGNGQAYNVVFATSPFSNITSGAQFPVSQVPPNQPTSSGGVAASVELQCVFGCTLQYKYSVSGSNGCSQDPMVVVQK